MTEPDSRLPIKNKLFGDSENMIQIRKEPVELESIRIPVRKQAHLNDDAYKRRKLTGSKDDPFAETGIESKWRSTDYKSM